MPSILHYRASISLPFLISIAISLLYIFPSYAPAWEIPANKVHDGDTIEVYRKGREVDVRFYGIDGPEKDQPHGMKAKGTGIAVVFSIQGGAQKFFDSQGPGDPHRLDGDGDGVPCEGLR